MVQKHVRAEVDLRNIGDRSSRSSADGQKIQPRGEQHAQAPEGCRLRPQPPAVEKPHDAPVDPDHQHGIGGAQQRLPHPEPEIDARHRLPRIGEINQHRAVEPEAPMLVERHVDGENRSRKDGDRREISDEHPPPETLRQCHPQRQKGHEQRQRRNVPGDRGVELQPVPHDAQPLRKGGRSGLSGIVNEKNGFLHGHQHDGRTESRQNEQQFFLHLRYSIRPAMRPLRLCCRRGPKAVMAPDRHKPATVTPPTPRKAAGRPPYNFSP